MLSKGKKLVIEIGTFLGASAEAILEGGAEHLITIDTFRGVGSGVGFGDDHIYRNNDRMAVVSEALRRLDRFGDRVTVIAGSSEFTAPLFADGIADMIFLDGAHDYASVKRDIEIWESKLTPDGVMCGHDFDHVIYPPENMVEYHHLHIAPDNVHYGVIKAVNECYSRFNLVVHNSNYEAQQSSTIWVGRERSVHRA